MTNSLFSWKPLTTALLLAGTTLPALDQAEAKSPQEPPKRQKGQEPRDLAVLPKLPEIDTSKYPLERYENNGKFNHPMPWLDAGHRAEYISRMAQQYTTPTEQAEVFIIASEIARQQYLQEKQRLSSQENPFVPEARSGEQIAANIQNAIRKARESGRGFDLPNLISSTISSPDKAGKTLAQFALKESINFLLDSNDPLALEKAAFRTNEKLTEQFIAFIYDASLKSVLEDPRTKPFAQTAKGVDLSLGPHKGVLFCHSKSEMSAAAEERAQKEVKRLVTLIEQTNDPYEKAALKSLLAKKSLAHEIEQLKSQAVNGKNDPLLQKRAMEAAAKLQKLVNEEVKTASQRFANHAKASRQGVIALAINLSSIEIKDVKELSTSLSGLGRAIGSKEVMAIGSLTSSSLDFVQNMGKAGELLNTNKAAGVMKGLSASLDLASALVSIFNLLFGGPSIDEQILEQVIELRKEVQTLRQEMHQEFFKVHRALTEVYTDIMRTLIRIEQKVDKVDESVKNAHKKLDNLGYSFALSDLRNEDITRFLAKKLLPSDLKDALKVRAGDKVTQQQFGSYLKALEVAACEDAGDLPYTGPRSISKAADEVFRSFIAESRDAADPRNIPALLSQIAGEQLKNLELTTPPVAGRSQPINPHVWAHFVLHYMKFITNYPELYKSYLDSQPNKQDPLLENLRATALQYCLVAEGIRAETLKNALRHYIHGAVEVEVERLKQEATDNQTKTLNGLANWKLLSRLESNVPNLVESAPLLLKNLVVPDFIDGDGGKGFTERNALVTYALPTKDLGLKEYVTTNYPQFAIAEVLGLGRIKYCYEAPFWTNIRHESHPDPAKTVFGSGYHFLLGKLYITIRADFIPNAPPNEPIHVFKVMSVGPNEEYVGDATYFEGIKDDDFDVKEIYRLHIHYHNTQLPFSNIPGINNPALTQQQKLKALFEERRKSDLGRERYGLERVEGELPWAGKFHYMRKTDRSILKASVQSQWEHMAKNFFKNGTELAPAPLSTIPQKMGHTAKVLLDVARMLNRQERAFEEDWLSPTPLAKYYTGERVTQARKIDSAKLNKILLPVLRDYREAAAAIIQNGIASRSGQYSTAAYRMDGARGVLNSLGHLKWGDREDKESATALLQLTGLTAIPSAAEYAEIVNHRMNGRTRSLRYGWYTSEEESALRKDLLAKKDFDPKIDERSIEKFESDMARSKGQADALREGLRLAMPYISRPDILSELGITEVTDVERAKIYRFVPKDIQRLTRIFAELSVVNSTDALFIEPHEEVLLRAVLTYKAIVEAKGSRDDGVTDILQMLDDTVEGSSNKPKSVKP